MATAKKRTKKTAAAKTAATKTSQGAKQGAKKTATPETSNKKNAAAKSAKKAPRSAPTRADDLADDQKAKVKKASAKKAAKAESKKAKAKSSAKQDLAREAADETAADPFLFEPLTEGERAEALRTLTEDPRLIGMAEVGRYRVIAAEPLAVKAPHRFSGKRLARIVIYDYANDRSVDGCVDLDSGAVAYLHISRAQPMLARAEEAAAISIAMSDERVKQMLSLGDEPQVAMHYWSSKDSSLSFARRSAAVLFGPRSSRPSLVAVVDLLDNLVCEIVPGPKW